MQTDPFTRASATYRNAMRHAHKSGAAWEGYTPRPSRIPAYLALAGLALFAATLIWGI